MAWRFVSSLASTKVLKTAYRKGFPLGVNLGIAEGPEDGIEDGC
jgi:hypothetical protein